MIPFHLEHSIKKLFQKTLVSNYFQMFYSLPHLLTIHMMRAMCGAKLMEKKRTKDLMEMLGLKETVVQMANANGVRWYRHVLRRDDGHVLRKELEFEVKGKRKRGRPNNSWKTQVEKESKSFGLEKEDAMNRARWRVGVGETAVRVG